MSQPASGWPLCYNHFFGQLRNIVGAGKPGQWKAMCPAHDDKIQSLSVRVGNRGQLWVRCHAGGLCSLSAIVRAANSEIDDLFPDNKRYTKQEGKKHMAVTETTYQYLDENGQLLFEAVRREPKSFRQRRPNPAFDPAQPTTKENAEYLYDLQGVRRVLYNLPFLLSALSRTPDKVILVVEGEKDVETAKAVGIMATTNPMGAGKWLPEYAQFLKGANVVVIPDNDEPGKKHADDVCKSLNGVARTVRLLTLPGLGEKEDFTDWWQKVAKGSTDQKRKALRDLINGSRLYDTDATTAPPVVPSGSTPEPKPAPVPEPPKEKPVTEQPKEQLPANATAEQQADFDKFPSSPTIRNGVGAPNPKPGIAPNPVAVEPETKTEAVKIGPVPTDRAARVAMFFKDSKATAAALKNGGCKITNHLEFYAAVRIAISQMDSMYSMQNGAPVLDNAGLGQIALLMGAYLLTAAADFGLGCGLNPEQPANTEPAK